MAIKREAFTDRDNTMNPKHKVSHRTLPLVFLIDTLLDGAMGLGPNPKKSPRIAESRSDT